MKTKSLVSTIAVVLALCGCGKNALSAQNPQPPTTAGQKTFATLLEKGIFLTGGHQSYTAFTDSDIAVYKVTNLNKSGEGSLAWATSRKGPRVVVFEVGGIIDMDGGELKLQQPYLYIAGQTAPSPGITIIRGEISIQANDIIVRHITIRPGDMDQPKKSGWEADGMSTWKARNILVDHCTMTWATDEALSASGPRLEGPENTSHDVTFSNNIISESLHDSTHPKGTHSMGTLIHDFCQNIAVVGNLYASNGERNPLLKPNSKAYIANNLIYNPGRKAIHASWIESEYGGQTDLMNKAEISVLGNVLIKGPSTPADFWMVSGPMAVFQSDNTITTGFDVKGETKRRIMAGDVETLRSAPVTTDRYQLKASATLAPELLSTVGSRPGDRSSVDARIINDVKSGTGKILDSQNEVGGYPSLQATQRTLDVPATGIEKWLEEQSNALN